MEFNKKGFETFKSDVKAALKDVGLNRTAFFMDSQKMIMKENFLPMANNLSW